MRYHSNLSDFCQNMALFFALECVTFFLPFALTRECALHLRLCEKTRKTYFACSLVGFSKTKR